jgi:hypothetical protein
MTALRAVWPAWPVFDAHGVADEAALMGTLLGRVVDRVDALEDELWPDGATADIERWERNWRVPVRPADDAAKRRARLLSVIGRIPGSTPAQVRQLLASAFDLAEEDVLLLEMLRSEVEKAMTAREEFGGASGLFLASGESLIWHVPAAWPGTVDDVGVALTLDYETESFLVATVTHADGTSWVEPSYLNQFRAPATRRKRGVFSGRRAAGGWTVRLDNVGGDDAIVWAVELMVSNDEDSRQIYHVYAVRDPNLAGTPDLVEAHRLFATTVHAHSRRYVCERTTIRCDEPRSLCDRDVIGS